MAAPAVIRCSGSMLSNWRSKSLPAVLISSTGGWEGVNGGGGVRG